LVDQSAGASAKGVKRRRRLGPATLISLLVHLQLLVVVGLLAYWKAPRNAQLAPSEMIDITALDENASREIIADLDRQAQEEKKAEEEKKKDEEKANPDRQVIDLPTPRNETPPKDAKYAAEHDSTVQKETHRRGVAEQPRPQPQPSLLAMRAPTPPSRAPGTQGTPGAPQSQLSGQDPETESLPRQGTTAMATISRGAIENTV
jgi:outer membrane biosynthesis protein TonB